MRTNRRILVIDIGGTRVKLLVTDIRQPILTPSKPTLTPGVMIRQVEDAVKNFRYDLVSIGYPGPIVFLDSQRVYQVSMYTRRPARRADIGPGEYSDQHDTVFLAGASGYPICCNQQ